MNPAEQKSHKNATDTLRADLKQLCEDFDALDTRVTDNLKDNVTTQTGLREDFSNAVRSVTDLRVEHQDLIGAVTLEHRAFVKRGFWSRLNWLITGR